MKIAIIGGGISGLGCAYLLHPHHDITLFETNDYLGGHAKTSTIVEKNKAYHLDQGFMVFNERNYPLFTKLLKKLGTLTEESEMSFSIKEMKSGFEYKATNVFSWFAQKRNLFLWNHYKMFFELLRFKKTLSRNIHSLSPYLDLKTFLQQNNFTREFIDRLILPICSAIWSSYYKNILTFPVVLIYTFLNNHGILDLFSKTKWQCIQGGSKNYIQKIIKGWENKVALKTSIKKITRKKDKVVVVTDKKNHQQESYFDKVIIATHSDQALAMIKPTALEEEILKAIPYKRSNILVHHDQTIMPKKKRAWASWNYLVKEKLASKTLVTYNLEKIQNIYNSKNPFFISLNSEALIRPEKVLLTNEFAHPQFSVQSEKFKKMLPLINGKNNTYYCGAYWYNGFHEDGFKSAVEVAKQLKIAF